MTQPALQFIETNDDTPRPSARVTRAFRAVSDPAARRILVVDDEDALRNALVRFLKSRGYEVTGVPSGPDALIALESEKFVLMLCDVRMPEMTGVQLVPRALELDPDLAVVMLTAVNDAPTATEALGSGAMDYLMKPIELDALQAAVDRLLHRRELTIEQRNVERVIREEVAARTEELERDKAALRQMALDVVDTLVNAQEAKSAFLRGHSQRVADLAASIAGFLRLDEDLVEDIRLAARLHDIGKIGVREEVLDKPGPLTDEERAHVRGHVRMGVDILTPLTHIARILPYVLDHHEHWDGTGYPRALAGADISIGGRIIAAADAYDALTSRRAWREPMTPRETIEFLETRVGSQLDPGIFSALQSIVLRRKSLVFIDAIDA
ncbi:MAG: response regulator [Gemmatimonadaceae bacterium]|nr:response regulator [Gemmatimonadaceae bacterium]